MKESDYIKVSTLIRLRIVSDILREVPADFARVPESEWLAAKRTIAASIARLEMGA